MNRMANADDHDDEKGFFRTKYYSFISSSWWSWLENYSNKIAWREGMPTTTRATNIHYMQWTLSVVWKSGNLKYFCSYVDDDGDDDRYTSTSKAEMKSRLNFFFCFCSPFNKKEYIKLSLSSKFTHSTQLSMYYKIYTTIGIFFGQCKDETKSWMYVCIVNKL